jgi:DNA-binding beta-propeller fold protein YncE
MLRSMLAVSMAIAAVAIGAGTPQGASARSTPAGEAASVSQLPQLLGFANGAIVRVDAGSLQPLPGARLAVGSGGCAARYGGTACWSAPPWTVAPNARRLAVARNGASSVEVIDPRTLRVLARIPVGGGSIGALSWLKSNRLLALQETGGERQRLLVLDPTKRRVIARHPLNGSVQRLAVAGQELVLVLSPAQKIGPARIAVVSATGAVRVVALGQIRAGSKLLGTGSQFAFETQLPGLAVDSAGGHAFVVDQGRVADVDLVRLTVSYHALSRQTAAATKEVSGHQRDAILLGGGALAVSGSDTTRDQTQPAGLVRIDTKAWSARTLNPDATSVELAGNLLLASGMRPDAAGKAVGIGLAAYGLDGSNRFQVLDGQPTWLALAYGGRAYVGVSGEDPLTMIDLASGAVAGHRTRSLPTLLLGRGAGWWQQPITP